MENIPKPIKYYVCPSCKTPIPLSGIMSQLGGKGVKNPKKNKGSEFFKRIAKLSVEARRLKKKKIEFGYMDGVIKFGHSQIINKD